MGTLKEMLSADRFAAEAGVELLEISPGYAKARMKVTEKHLNAGYTARRWRDSGRTGMGSCHVCRIPQTG